MAINIPPIFTSGFAQRVTEKGGTVPSAFSEALGAGTAKAGLALGALALLGAGALAVRSTKNAYLSSKFATALAQVSRTNPIVAAADPNRVTSYAATIFKFAPHIASDPNLLGSVLANAIHGEGIDPMTIKTLIEMEAKYSDMQGTQMVSPVKLGP